MARRGENIRKRKDGRWEGRYIKERTPQGSRYGYVYGKTYSEVKSKKAQQITALKHPCKSRPISMESLFMEWEEALIMEVKGSTYTNYSCILHKHIAPFFQKLKISQLSNELIQQFIKLKLQEEIGAGTLRIIMTILRDILNFAAKKQMYPQDVISFEYPRERSCGHQLMEEQDYLLLLSRLFEPQSSFEFGILLCLCTGIRVGELCGLRWEDLNLKKGVVNIQRTVGRMKNMDKNVRTKTRIFIDTPKTPNSRRQIPIPDALLAKIPSFAACPEYFILSGSGRCIEPRSVQRRFKRLLESLNIPPTGIHTLRHQFASRWIDSGFDVKSLSEILGHSSVKTTLDIYVHTNQAVKRNHMNQMLLPV